MRYAVNVDGKDVLETDDLNVAWKHYTDLIRDSKDDDPQSGIGLTDSELGGWIVITYE